VLLDTMYEIPSLDSVQKVVVDERAIAGESEPYLVYDSDQDQQRAASSE